MKVKIRHMEKATDLLIMIVSLVGMEKVPYVHSVITVSMAGKVPKMKTKNRKEPLDMLLIMIASIKWMKCGRHSYWPHELLIYWVIMAESGTGFGDSRSNSK